MTKNVNQTAVNLCGDCIAFDANGTVGDDPDYTPDAPPMGLLDGYLIGPDESDHECEGHFSWDSCDGCGTFLGGNRYCYVAICVWVGHDETCPVCGQPDNCGDCTHEPVSK